MICNRKNYMNEYWSQPNKTMKQYRKPNKRNVYVLQNQGENVIYIIWVFPL